MSMKGYERWIKSQPCIHCGREGETTWHHPIHYGDGFMAGKAPDIMAVPLCVACHNHFHEDFKNDPEGWLRAQFRWLTITLTRAMRDKVLRV